MVASHGSHRRSHASTCGNANTLVTAAVTAMTPATHGTPAQLVFTQVDGGPIDPRRDWQDWQDILLAAGADPARVHAMRHTAATTLLELGVDIRVAQEMLGHTDIRTTRAYTTVTAQLTKAAAERMGEALFGGATASNLDAVRQ